MPDNQTSTDIAARREVLRLAHRIWPALTLAGWLDACASRFPMRPLVIADECQLTYSEAAEQSRLLADGLASLGVVPGDRVAMVMANHPEFVTLKFAIARVGAIAVPVNYFFRAEELRYVIADARCRVVVAMTEHAGLRPADQLRGMSGGPTLVVFDTDGTAPEDVMTVRHLAELGRLHCGAASNATDTAGHTQHRAADIFYTSGTTGAPRGVLVSHDSQLRSAYASALTRAFEDGRRILFSLPCYHLFGYVEGLLAATFVGGAAILQTSFSAGSSFAGIESHRATDILCVPTMVAAMLEDPTRAHYDVSSLSAMLCGSTAAPVRLWEAAQNHFGVDEIVTGYGMTETSGAVTLTRPEDPLALTAVTVGRPKMAGCAGLADSDELAVLQAVDPETGMELPKGAEGEIVSRGPSVMQRYWNRTADTAAALRGGGLHSGDLGYVGEDGYVRITGRSKELYKSGGELVMPKEVERILESHDSVSQAFVFGLPDAHWGESGCAVVVQAAGSTATEAELVDLCRRHLARFKVPKRVVFYRAEDLPVTPTGKVQKFRLVEQVGATLRTDGAPA